MACLCAVYVSNCNFTELFLRARRCPGISVKAGLFSSIVRLQKKRRRTVCNINGNAASHFLKDTGSLARKGQSIIAASVTSHRRHCYPLVFIWKHLRASNFTPDYHKHRPALNINMPPLISKAGKSHTRANNNRLKAMRYLANQSRPHSVVSWQKLPIRIWVEIAHFPSPCLSDRSELSGKAGLHQVFPIHISLYQKWSPRQQPTERNSHLQISNSRPVNRSRFRARGGGLG